MAIPELALDVDLFANLEGRDGSLWG